MSRTLQPPAAGFRVSGLGRALPTAVSCRPRLCENPMNLSPSGTAPHYVLGKAPLARSSHHSGSIQPLAPARPPHRIHVGRFFTQPGPKPGSQRERMSGCCRI